MKVLVFRYPRNKITDLLICLFCVFLIILILQYDTYSEAVSGASEEEYVLKFLADNGIFVCDDFIVENIVLSRSNEKVFSDYNSIQKENGFDMEPFIGKEVRRYTFEVNNNPYTSEEVFCAVVFTFNGEIIGADIHSPSVNGFIQGVKNNIGEIKIR